MICACGKLVVAKGLCGACYMRARRAANPQHDTEVRRLWQKANRKKLSAKAKARYQANPEAGASKAREWRKANPDRVAAAVHKWSRADERCAEPRVTKCCRVSDKENEMNTLKNGTVAVGAPGSEARRQSEKEDARKQLLKIKEAINGLEGMPVSYRLCVKVPDFMAELDAAIASALT